jgi:dethiobiotin synthetase
MSNTYFITATGTDIGKTYVAALLCRIARMYGKEVVACKPIISGVERLEETDSAALLNALGMEVTEANFRALSPWQFRAPLSPHRAAALEGQTLSLDAIMAWCESWLQQHDPAFRLIEGVGGAIVPLTYDTTTLEWMQRLNLPTLLVTGDYLGTLSHTLTALTVLKQAGVRVAGIVVNESEVSVEHAETIHTLRAFSPFAVPIVSLPRNSALLESDAQLTHAAQHPTYTDFFSLAASLMGNEY